MMSAKVLFVKYADKGAALFAILWAIYYSFNSIYSVSVAPEIVAKADNIIEKVKKVNNPAPIYKAHTYKDEFVKSSKWVSSSYKDDLRNPYYRQDEINFDAYQEEFNRALQNCKHFFYSEDENDPNSYCIFPTCQEIKTQADRFLGPVVDFMVESSTVMDIRLKWKEPTRNFKVVVTHSTIEMREKGKEEWLTAKDEKGEIIKIVGYRESIVQNEEDIEESVEGFSIEGEEEKVEEVDKVEETPLNFSYLHYNLAAGTEYEYRVKAWGYSTAIKDKGQSVQGDSYSPIISAKTQADKGVRFVRYIPGVRDRHGDIAVRKDGTIVSPDRVNIIVGKQYSPPWSEVKYIMSHEIRGIVPGPAAPNTPNINKIGQEHKDFWITTRDGRKIYVNVKTGEYRYYGKPKSIFSVPEGYVEPDMIELTSEEKSESKYWKAFRDDVSFETGLEAVEVKEKVVEKVDVKSVFSAEMKGMVNKETVFKEYHYYLILKNISNGELKEVELERDEDEYKRRLLTGK